MKKFMVLLMAIILILPGVGAIADTPDPNADTMFWIQEGVTGKVGDMVNVDIMLQTKYELSSWGLEFTYDANALRLIYFTERTNDGLKGALVATNSNDPGIVRSYGVFAQNGVSSDALMYRARFEILSENGGWLMIQNASYALIKNNNMTETYYLEPVFGAISAPAPAQAGETAVPVPTPDPVQVAATAVPPGTTSQGSSTGSSTTSQGTSPSATPAIKSAQTNTTNKPNNTNATNKPNNTNDTDDRSDADGTDNTDLTDADNALGDAALSEDGDALSPINPADSALETDTDFEDVPSSGSSIWLVVLLVVAVLCIGAAVTAALLNKRARKKGETDTE